MIHEDLISRVEEEEVTHDDLTCRVEAEELTHEGPSVCSADRSGHTLPAGTPPTNYVTAQHGCRNGP